MRLRREHPDARLGLSSDWVDQAAFRAIVIITGGALLHMMPAESVADLDKPVTTGNTYVPASATSAVCDVLPPLIPDHLAADGKHEVYKISPHATCLTTMYAPGTKDTQRFGKVAPGKDVVIACNASPGVEPASALLSIVDEAGIVAVTGEIRTNRNTLQQVDTLATGC
jgi:hypothetical protein